MLEFILCALVACATFAFVYWKLHRSNMRYIPKGAEIYLPEDSGRFEYESRRLSFYQKIA